MTSERKPIVVPMDLLILCTAGFFMGLFLAHGFWDVPLALGCASAMSLINWADEPRRVFIL